MCNLNNNECEMFFWAAAKYEVFMLKELSFNIYVHTHTYTRVHLPEFTRILVSDSAD